MALARGSNFAQSAWLALWRTMRRYHRYEVEGFHHLESAGAALLVGYHARGTAHDLCMLTTVIHERLGYLPHGIIHGFYGAQPLLRKMIDDLGFVTADGPALQSAVARGEHILVQPGGTREGCRSFRHRARVDWGTRTGYLQLALRHGLKIIPIGGDGLDGGFIGLNDGRALGRKLNLPHRLPLWIGLGPLGLWPFSPPFPVKITQRIGAPIDPLADGPLSPDDPDALQQMHRRVSDAVQALLERPSQLPYLQ